MSYKTGQIGFNIALDPSDRYFLARINKLQFNSKEAQAELLADIHASYRDIAEAMHSDPMILLNLLKVHREIIDRDQIGNGKLLRPLSKDDLEERLRFRSSMLRSEHAKTMFFDKLKAYIQSPEATNGDDLIRLFDQFKNSTSINPFCNSKLKGFYDSYSLPHEHNGASENQVKNRFSDIASGTSLDLRSVTAFLRAREAMQQRLFNLRQYRSESQWEQPEAKKLLIALINDVNRAQKVYDAVRESASGLTPQDAKPYLDYAVKFASFLSLLEREALLNCYCFLNHNDPNHPLLQFQPIKEKLTCIDDMKNNVVDEFARLIRLIVRRTLFAKGFGFTQTHLMDALQASFLKVLESLASIDPSKSDSTRAYIAAITQSAVLNLLVRSESPFVNVSARDRANPFSPANKLASLNDPVVDNELGRVELSDEENPLQASEADSLRWQALVDRISESNDDSVAVDHNELKLQIAHVLKSLPYRERQIIKLRYGLDGEEPNSLREIGNKFKVTKERIRQIESKAIKKLQHPSRSEYLEDFFSA